jgi:hypothetical protein
VLARLRNNAPLVVEKKFGAGRVIAQLTKLSSGDTPLGRWSNWSLNPAFPVLANELVSYLAASRQVDPLFHVGDDLIVSVDEGKYDPSMRFVKPGEGAGRGEEPVKAKPVDGRLTARLPDVAESGVYQLQLQPFEGNPENRAYAVNVKPGEGDLALEQRPELMQQLAGVKFELHEASDMALNAQQVAGFAMSDALLAVLVVMLVSEQLFAYMASYHVTPVRGAKQ